MESLCCLNLCLIVLYIYSTDPASYEYCEYCSHLQSGAPQYQLKPYECIQRRAVRVVGIICERLDTLTLRRDVSSLCILYRLYCGGCSEEFFGLIFCRCVQTLICFLYVFSVIHNLVNWNYNMYNWIPHNRGIATWWQCFQIDTIWISSIRAFTIPYNTSSSYNFFGFGDHLLSWKIT